MANWNDNQQSRSGFGMSPSQTGDLAGRETFDAGLRKHMLSIYNYMASGVLLTGIVAMLFVNSPLFATAFQVVQTPQGVMVEPSMLGWIIKLSPLAFIAFWWFGAKNAGQTVLQAMFWGFAVAFGLSLSTIAVMYTGESIATTFFATSAAFAGLSLWGYTTKKDISGWGSFLFMGLIGLIVVSLLNAFLIQSNVVHFAMSAIGVLIFAGFTAYDTQRLKSEYVAVQQLKLSNPAAAAAFPTGRLVIFGALSLYLDFINLFLMLLQFLGNRE